MLRYAIQRLFADARKLTSKTRTTSNGRRIILRARLFLEPLETREVPAVILVTNPGDAGPGTLRQAILDANTTGDMDEIQIHIDPSTETIRLESELPEIVTSMEINGATVAAPTITLAFGAGPFRLFTAHFNGNIVAFRNLILTGGSADDGGAIWSWANLTVENCTFTFNTATGSGGAIFQSLAPLAVTGSTFDTNGAGINGGAIHFESGGIQPLTVQDSIFINNIAQTHGGGIFYDARGVVTITGSHFNQNGAINGNGGGIHCVQCAELIVVAPPTLQGGIFNFANEGGMIFAHVDLNLVIDTFISENHAGFLDQSAAFFITLSPAATVSINFAEIFDPFVLNQPED